MGLSVQYASIREVDCNQKYMIPSSTASQTQTQMHKSWMHLERYQSILPLQGRINSI